MCKGVKDSWILDNLFNKFSSNIHKLIDERNILEYYLKKNENDKIKKRLKIVNEVLKEYNENEIFFD